MAALAFLKVHIACLTFYCLQSLVTGERLDYRSFNQKQLGII